MKTREYNIAILLPTHKRTDAFSLCLFSLIDLAKDLDSIQFLMGIDNDDKIGLNHFTNVIQPELDARGINYTAVGFEHLGYAGLNRYFDTLASHADADWHFCWCDDAIMDTQDWDERIRECTGEFKLLKVHTHNEHPYSIFPIMPAEWREVTGYLSRHQLIDTEVSHIAYFLDIMKIIEVDVTHNRPELTGVEADDTAKQKQYFEGNPKASPIHLVLPALYASFSKIYSVFGMKDQSDAALKPLFYFNLTAVKNAQETMRNYQYAGIEKILLLLHHYNLKGVGVGDAGTSDASLMKEMVVKMIAGL